MTLLRNKKTQKKERKKKWNEVQFLKNRLL